MKGALSRDIWQHHLAYNLPENTVMQDVAVCRAHTIRIYTGLPSAYKGRVRDEAPVGVLLLQERSIGATPLSS